MTTTSTDKSKLAYYVASFTLDSFISKFYNNSIEEVQNPEYKDPHPSCSHYASVSEILSLFCPSCGQKNRIITYPERITTMVYRMKPEWLDTLKDNNFGDVHLSRSSLMMSVITRIKSQAGVLMLRSGSDERYQVKVDADGRSYRRTWHLDLNRSLVWLSSGYSACSSQDCISIGCKNKGGANLDDVTSWCDIGDYSFYLVFYSIDKRPTENNFKECLFGTTLSQMFPSLEGGYIADIPRYNHFLVDDD